MRIEILGSAAGGGFPQWNCNCTNCQSLRAGTFQGSARTQTQVAVTNNNQHWFLLGASPDLRLQTEASKFLHPREGLRNSPLQGVILTSADVDQVAGMLSLRELQPLQVFLTPSLKKILCEDNSIFGMLNRVSDQVNWKEILPGKDFPLPTLDGSASGLACSPMSLGHRYPVYVSSAREGISPEESLLGLVVTSASGKRVAYMPAVPVIGDAFLRLLEGVDLLLFDGTFWTDDELIRVQGSGATAQEMGHVPVSGPDGTLQKLSGLNRPRKVFIHINNTNPMLNESGRERREVQDAGWEVAHDGWSADL